MNRLNTGVDVSSLRFTGALSFAAGSRFVCGFFGFLGVMSSSLTGSAPILHEKR